MSSSDVETFQGKIICNIDGNACIIDSENETFSKLTFKTTTFGPNSAKSFSTACNSAEGTATIFRGDNPKIHTFRVVSAQDADIGFKNDFSLLKTEKPILMCFICKLSFGNTKSFSTHANTEHTLDLLEIEQQLLKHEFSSAIIQRNMDEKPQISFLEPIEDQMDTSSLESFATNKIDVNYENKTIKHKTNLEEQNTKQSSIDCESPAIVSTVNLHEDSGTAKIPLAYVASQQYQINLPVTKYSTDNNITSQVKQEHQKTNTLEVTTEAIATAEKCTDNLSSIKLANKDIENKDTEPSSSPIPIQSASTDFTTLNSSVLRETTNKHSPHRLTSHSSGIDSGKDENQQDSTLNSSFTDSETHISQINSLHASLAALTNDQQYNGNVKFISEFLQQQLQSVALQQKQIQQAFPTCFEHGDIKGTDCKNCEQIEAHYQLNSPHTPLRSPNNSLLTSNLAVSPTSATNMVNVNTNTASCFTIGACSDHVNGRPVGVDCTRCEMILNSARLNNGAQLSTRNSCKTLKCPQCNWHYKYQETLEIHMREKHPDGESACGYCLAGQQHPRLARGESYSCGYKPYRCEICNYSTTTKGNLSIHMQSDKHLNNMQELNSTQNIVAAAVAAGSKIESGQNKILLSNSSNGSGQINQQQPSVVCSTPSSTSSALNTSTNSVNTSSSRPKPNFRCDICSYETSVARNLRIHMTSEKHTHNMAVLQSNIKHIHALSLIQQQQQQQQHAINAGSNIPNLPPYTNVGLPVNNFLPEVAIADLAYNQAIMIQMLQQNAAAAAAAISTSSHSTTSSGCSENKTTIKSSSPIPPNTSFSEYANQQYFDNQLDINLSSNQNVTPSAIINDNLDFPPVKPDPWPTTIFSCQVCSIFNTNSLDELNQHILIDRSRCSNGGNNDIMLIQNNNYICRLCNYKTNLKANFQLHSKTDKHLQKLNYINHIREGGPFNEYKLKFLQHQQAASNMVHLKCNCCDFLTNSIQKLTLHSQHMRHDTMRMIFQQLLYITQQYQCLKKEDNSNPSDHDANSQYSQLNNFDRSIECQLCSFNARNLLEMVQHVKSLRHMQMEQFICLQRSAEKMQPLNLEDVFKLSDPLVNGEDFSQQEPNNRTKNTCDTATELIERNEDPCSLAYNKNDGAELPLESTTLITSNIEQCGQKLDHNNSSNEISKPAVPLIVYKCLHCDFFAQIKRDIEMHIESIHQNCDIEDYMSIPTNAAAIQAFQAALAAVTLSAAKRSENATSIPFCPKEDFCPIPIKKERVDPNENEEIGIVNLEIMDDQNKADKSPRSDSKTASIQCPLCHDVHNDKNDLEAHLINVHTVKRDGLARLLQLVEKSVWQDSSKFSTVSEVNTSLNDATFNTSCNEFLCQVCQSSYKYVEQLLQHAQNSQHYALKNGEYLCLGANNINSSCTMTFAVLNNMLSHYKDVHMSLVISERHVYKYRCKQCSLAFKTQEKLTAHSLYHTMRDATKCGQCQRNFRTTQAMQKHIEQAHNVCSSTSTEAEKLQESQITFKTTGSATEAVENIQKSQPSSPTNELEKRIDSPKLSESSDLNKDVNQHEQSHVASFNLVKNQHKINECSESDQILVPNPVHDPTQDLQTSSTFQNFLPQPLQNLQTLQQMQAQLPQMAAAAAAAGIPLNPVDMLNLMQFHHLLSLNFMNLAPPLVFRGSSPTNLICGNSQPSFADVPITEMPISSAATTPNIENSNSQAMLQQEQSPNSSQLSNNQKRARTRITDDQLKILRAHFDINNSPSEESIMEMSQKANLPMKVVKHWFRNTLFKERQRNKDSPYNFNNPPSTTLNLEEYERTGQTKVTSVSDINDSTGACNITFVNTTTQSRPSSNISVSNNIIDAASAHQQEQESEHHSEASSTATHVNVPTIVQNKVTVKSEPSEENAVGNFEKFQQKSKLISNATIMASFIKQQLASDQPCNETGSHSPSNIQHPSHQTQIQQNTLSNYETKSESESSDVLSRPQTPTSTSTHSIYSGMNEILAQQMDSIPLMSNLNNMGPPKKFQVSKSFDKNSPSSQFDTNSNSSNSSSSSGKRANRTRFTDYQIKVLQEFFENNSYPKDSDLEYLSKLLLLSPRVIVVWFQNARQKQRKIYENQPNNSIFESEEKKQNINYTCKKCNLVFQRYYELIRHQKNHCFKEENNKKSAKAQKAAAQIAQNFSSEDSNSSLDMHNNISANSILSVYKQTAGVPSSVMSPNVSGNFGQTIISASPQHNSVKSLSPSTTPTPPHCSVNYSEKTQEQQKQKFNCDKCNLSFITYDQLKSHQIIHVMNQNFNANSQNGAPSYGSFGSLLQSLQQAAVIHQQQNITDLQLPPAKKRKFSETSSNDDYSSFGGTLFKVDDLIGAGKKYEALLQYFIQNEPNAELKHKFLVQRQRTPDSDAEVEFLSNYYQQSESKKITNYDFLYQYFIKNEQHENQNQNQNQQEHLLHQSSNEKPNLEYLLRYYQLNESRKFFPLQASLQTKLDGLPSPPYYQFDNMDSKQTASSDNLDLNELKNKEQNDSNLYDNISKNDFNQTIFEKDKDKPSDIDCKLHSSSIDEEKKSTLNSQNVNNYFNSLEDFLDATMVENDTQTLTFNNTNMATTTNSATQLSANNPKSSNEKQNKRLRTTILPEQLNFLYECYQNESNPSRKMLEEIAKKVNLKKRVVQVWFQNSRAKDKKSRNQRQYSGISDDNSSHDDVTRDVNHKFNCKNAGKLSADSDGSNQVSNEIIRDCEICQVEQVDIKQHTFTIEHIRNVKALLQQTGVSSDLSKSISDNTSESDDVELDGSRKKNLLNSNILGNIHIQNEKKDKNSKINPIYFTNGNLIGQQNIDPMILHRQEDDADDYTETKSVSNQQLELTESVKDTVSKKSHLNDIIRKFFNCNQITVMGGK